MNSHRIPFAAASVKFIKFNSLKEKLEVLGSVIMKALVKSARWQMAKDAHVKF